MPIRAKSIWHSIPGSPSTTGTVPAAAAALIVGAFLAVAVQRALGTITPWRASRSPILTTVRPSSTHMLMRSWLAHNTSHADPNPWGRSGRTTATTAPINSSSS